MALHVIASLFLKPEHAAAAEAELRSMVAKTRTEPGNRRYDLFREQDGSPNLHLYEIYDDRPPSTRTSRFRISANSARSRPTGSPRRRSSRCCRASTSPSNAAVRPSRLAPTGPHGTRRTARGGDDNTTRRIVRAASQYTGPGG